MEDEFAEHLQKRIRNLQKRERKLESYRELPANSLDEHQKAALATKEAAVDAPLRDLRELLSMYEREIARRAELEQSRLQQAVEAAEKRVADSLKGGVCIPANGMIQFLQEDETTASTGPAASSPEPVAAPPAKAPETEIQIQVNETKSEPEAEKPSQGKEKEKRKRRARQTPRGSRTASAAAATAAAAAE